MGILLELCLPQEYLVWCSWCGVFRAALFFVLTFLWLFQHSLERRGPYLAGLCQQIQVECMLYAQPCTAGRRWTSLWDVCSLPRPQRSFSYTYHEIINQSSHLTSAKLSGVEWESKTLGAEVGRRRPQERKWLSGLEQGMQLDQTERSEWGHQSSREPPALGKSKEMTLT